MQSFLNFAKLIALITLTLTVFFAFSSTTYAATICSGKPVPAGFTCPPPRTPESPPDINIGKLPNGETGIWTQCEDYMMDSPTCVNGWRPAYLRKGIVAGINEVEVIDRTGEAIEEVKGECSESYKDSTWKYVGCVVGGAVTKALGGLFSFKNLFWATSGLGWLLLMVAQMFMGWAAWWLDGSIYYMMVLMGFYINHEASAKGIQYAWSVVRDLTNILIIAGFVAVGISTILQIGQYAADKFLARLIIAALLVNFSYFIAGAVIDATNYIGIQIYNSDLLSNDCEVDSQNGTGIDPTGKARGDGTTITGPMRAIMALNDGRICNVARSMASYSGITTVDNVDALARRASNVDASALGPEWAKFDQPSWDPKNAKSDPATNYYFMFTLLSFMGAAFAFILGYVFTKAAMFLIVRFAALILLLVTSPLGIAGTNVPFIGGMAQKWWDALISQAMFAPVFIFLFAVGLSIVKQFAEVFNPVMKNGQSVAMSDAFFAAQHAAGQGLIGYVPIFITYFLAVLMTYLAYMVSSQIAGSVGELKGLYDAAAKYAWSTYMAPKNLPMKLPFIGGNALGGYAEDLAAKSRKGSWSRFMLSGTGGLIRTLDNAGSGKKQEKSGFQQAGESVDEKAKHKGDPDYRKWENGNMGQGALSTNRGRNGGKLSKEDQEKAQADYDKDTPENVRDRVGDAKFNQMAANGYFSADFLKKTNDSAEFTAAQKKAFNDSYFKTILDHKDAGRSKEAAEGIENLTEVERQILFTARQDLREDHQIVSQLKNDTYESATKHLSPADKKTADSKRAEGHASVFKEDYKGTEADRKTVIGNMSDKERVKHIDTVDKFKIAEPHLNDAQVRHIHSNTTNRELNSHISNHERWGPVVAVSTGVK